MAIGADVSCGECVFCEAGIGNNRQINYAMVYRDSDKLDMKRLFPVGLILTISRRHLR